MCFYWTAFLLKNTRLKTLVFFFIIKKNNNKSTSDGASILPSGFADTEQREMLAGERMTKSFRKAAMSVNMSHNGDMFADVQKETHRWHLSPARHCHQIYF